MQFEERRIGDIVVLAPGGDLNASEDCAAFEARLRAAMTGGTHDLILDCSAVNHVSGTAVRALLAASRRLAGARGQVILCAMGEMLTRVFAISGLIRGFPVLASADEAVQWTIERRNALIAEAASQPLPPEAPPREETGVPLAGTVGSREPAPAPSAARTDAPSREIADLADAVERFLGGAAPFRALTASCSSALSADEIAALAERLLAVVGSTPAAFRSRPPSRGTGLL